MPFEGSLKDYVIGKKIGAGGFSKVMVAHHKRTGEKVAIKVLDKSSPRIHPHFIYREIMALNSMDHPNICSIHRFFETEENYYIVLEYCDGVELKEYIESVNWTKSKARKIFRQIASALDYMHDHGYAHRDLKMQNIMVDEEMNVKIIDFGLCIKVMPNVMQETYCGTVTHVAPEIVNRKEYDAKKADMWSLGVLFYSMVFESLPFGASNAAQICQLIKHGLYYLPAKTSEKCASLISGLLQVDPNERLTIRDVIDHPWLTKDISPLDWSDREKVNENCKSNRHTLNSNEFIHACVQAKIIANYNRSSYHALGNMDLKLQNDATRMQSTVRKEETETQSNMDKKLRNVFRKVNLKIKKGNKKPQRTEPRTVKKISDLTHSTRMFGDEFLYKLMTALEERCIPYEREDYILHCNLKDDFGKTKLAFDIEVVQCIRQNVKSVGARRKLTKGDSFLFENLTNEILSLAEMVFKNDKEVNRK